MSQDAGTHPEDLRLLRLAAGLAPGDDHGPWAGTLRVLAVLRRFEAGDPLTRGLLARALPPGRGPAYVGLLDRRVVTLGPEVAYDLGSGPRRPGPIAPGRIAGLLQDCRESLLVRFDRPGLPEDLTREDP